MLEHDELHPEDLDGSDLQEEGDLVHDLRDLYATPLADQRSFAAIRARLVQRAATMSDLPDSVSGRRDGALPLMPLINEQRRPAVLASPRSQHISLMVASALIVFFMGSLVLTLIQIRQPQTSQIVKLGHGWTIAAQFSGTGSQTFSGLSLNLGHKFSYIATCSQQTGINVRYLGSSNTAEDETGGSCVPGDPTVVEQPAKYITTLTPSEFHGLQVGATAGVTWHVMLVTVAYYMPLTASAPWQALYSHEIAGSGSQQYVLDLTLPETAVGIEFVCYGQGTFTVTAQGNDNTTLFTKTHIACNGQHGFAALPPSISSKELRHLAITTSSDNDWQLFFVNCPEHTVCPQPV